MDNIFRGEGISKADFIHKLSELKAVLQEDIMQEPPSPMAIIEACHILSQQINQAEVIEELVALGIQPWAAEDYVKEAIESLDRDSLLKKLRVELGEDTFQWTTVADGIEERNFPLGVLIHIGAGNALGLSAFSVIEGLLTGNINILKLPEHEGGLSSRLLLELVKLEPCLKPYIYVLEVSSKNTEVINTLFQLANGIVVWGSDEAIRGIRQLAPPTVPIIEWGHKLSFAYFTENPDIEKDMEGLARDICLTDQLYCSSPQCVFYETDSKEELEAFAHRLSRHMAAIDGRFPAAARTMDIQSQITWSHQMVRMEALLGDKRFLTNDNSSFGIMVDFKSGLKASPLFRNIWVMPIKRGELFGLLRQQNGYLQTVGLSCGEGELEALSRIFYSAGVCRITACGHMSEKYIGEPHDGVRALSRYVRRVSRTVGRRSVPGDEANKV